MQSASDPSAAAAAEQSSLAECLLLLLRGIERHAVNAEEADARDFRAGMSALEKRVQAGENAREIADSAVALLDQYGARSREAMERKKAELESAASELAEAAKALPGMQGNAERWTRVEDQIKAVSSADDLEVVKARLCADVAVARAEALQERQKVGTIVAGVLNKVDVSLDRPAGEMPRPESSSVTTDQLTGLPARPQAEAELARALAQPADSYLAMFIVKRLALINARFGYSRGDEVLLKVVVHLAQSLPDFKALFRWAPCAFLTVAPPNTTYKDLRAKVQMIEITRLTPTLEWEGRSAMVPVVIDCRIVSVKDFPTPAELFLRLDTLAADA